MRKLWCGKLAAIVGLVVTGCVPQKPAVDPTAAVAQLSTGVPLLHCRSDCVAAWRRAQPNAAQLDATARWSELAALVISIGYQDDLTLFYLARAAEGLGYPAAAASYYRQSTYISGTALSCQHESAICGGVILPDAALARIDALESQTRRSRSRPRRQPATVAKPPPNGSKPLPAAEQEPAAACRGTRAAPARGRGAGTAAHRGPDRPAARDRCAESGAKPAHRVRADRRRPRTGSTCPAVIAAADPRGPRRHAIYRTPARTLTGVSAGPTVGRSIRDLRRAGRASDISPDGRSDSAGH